MKRPIINILLSLIAAVALVACHSNDLWDSLPEPIARFVSQYFPNTAVSDYSATDGNYHVKLSGAPSLTFDSNYEWTDINGRGNTLPEVLLFDRLPPALYNYLSETERLDRVYSMSRDAHTYTVVTSDTTLSYNIDTGRITGRQ